MMLPGSVSGFHRHFAIQSSPQVRPLGYRNAQRFKASSFSSSLSSRFVQKCIHGAFTTIRNSPCNEHERMPEVGTTPALYACKGMALLNSRTSRNLLNFMLLSGFLMLQGGQIALAETDASIEAVPFLGDLGDISTGFASAFLLIFFSELGDKTFFIAALLAARNSAATIFAGTFGALTVMTFISVVIGRTFHYVDGILPLSFGGTDLPIDDIAAALLLVYYGISTLNSASSDDDMNSGEQKEAEMAISKLSGNGAGILSAASTIISTFVLVFVAEWGDKSFFSTVALAAASSPSGVIAGSLAGHGAATLIAVLGGSLLSTFLSEKVISYIGGVLFLAFAAVTLIEIAS